MKMKLSILSMVAVMFTMSMATAADKTKSTTTTTISVKGMHCQACAKKLTDELKRIPGVAQSIADAEKGVAYALPAKGKKLPSPRAQWEAVVKVGFKPLRLAGPFGVFTSKPKF